MAAGTRWQPAQLPSSQRSTIRHHLDRAHIVIIGNGIAGLTAALEARRQAPDKQIVMITEQLYPTIHTPALKQYAVGKMEHDALLAYPNGTEQQKQIHILSGRVEGIHAQGKYVTLSDGRCLGYESLLLATGSTPRTLPTHLPGRGFDGMLTLHCLKDYMDLRRRLYDLRKAVVIGGGPHAIETVYALLSRGVRVHWLLRQNMVMPQVLDRAASDIVLASMERAGAIIHTETEVAAIVGHIGAVAGVITNQQYLIPCQAVLACIGTQPVTSLAQSFHAATGTQGGVMVDDHLHTNVPGIYAAGDVAALRNPLTGRYETRAQWYAAVTQGRIAGAMMASNDAAALEPPGVQWHATHLGDVRMLSIGTPLLRGERVNVLTDRSSDGYRRLVVADDCLLGYLSLGSRQPDGLELKRLIDGGYSVRPILRDLLKGTFDASTYFARPHSRTLQSIYLLSRVPAVAETPGEDIETRSFTGPQRAISL